MKKICLEFFKVFTKFHEKCVWKLLKVSRKIYEKKTFGIKKKFLQRSIKNMFGSFLSFHKNP
jgi:hypothetical protein